MTCSSHRPRATDRIWSSRDFFTAKVEEQRGRHAKFNDSSQGLEPDIKEGPGGLRDDLANWMMGYLHTNLVWRDVAIAAAIKADICEIYTDVDGIYTTDPNICPRARKMARVSYDEMLEMASLGAKVLQIRSVEFAKKYNVPVHVRSSFSDEEGTMVVNEEASMEKLLVSGVTCDKNQARITLKKVPDQPGVAAKVFSPVSEAGIVIDMIIQNMRSGGQTDLTFTVPETDFKQAMAIAEQVAKEIGAEEVLGDQNIAKVSVIGVGMRNHSGVASVMFNALAEENINIRMISTSEIRISCVVEEKYSELAVRVLHTAFGLDLED